MSENGYAPDGYSEEELLIMKIRSKARKTGKKNTKLEKKIMLRSWMRRKKRGKTLNQKQISLRTSIEIGTFDRKIEKRNHKNRRIKDTEDEDGCDEMVEKQSFQVAEDQPTKKSQRNKIQKISIERENKNGDKVELEHELDVHVFPSLKSEIPPFMMGELRQNNKFNSQIPWLA